MHENHGEPDEVCVACRTDIFEERGPLWKQREILVISGASVLFLLGVYYAVALNMPTAAEIAYLAAALVPGYFIIKNGILALVRKHRFDMNLLITVATVGAFAIGHGEEGASVMLLFFLAESLEEYAGNRARRSIGALLKLTPETAIVRRAERETTVHAHEVELGETVIVKPGERVPLDGVVTAGASSVNQAPITGESISVTKTAGDTVFAGSINEEGYLELRVTRKSDETTLSRIIQLAEQAQRKKTPTEAFIDRFSRYYTPSVIILAVLVATLPVLLLGLPFSDWFYKSLVLLVIACPCAMAISTPVSMISGLTLAAKEGILIKGGDVIEKLRDTKVAVFDKTGTITEGRPSVTDIVSVNGASEQEIVQIAASLEAMSTHPVALAITTRARENNTPLMPLTEFRTLPGKGLEGRWNGSRLYAGNATFFDDNGGLSRMPRATIDELEA